MNQSLTSVSIIIRPEERLLKTPILQELRRSGFLQRLDLGKCWLNVVVRQQGAFPIAFQTEQDLGEVISILVPNEIAAVISQDIEDRRVRIPAEPAPDSLVHIVIA